MTISNDAPIDTPNEDLFGLDPFSKAIANTISTLEAPDGLVLAINGPWGSGKSSAVNLIRHYLTPAGTEGTLQTVVFNPWWFAGADALTLSFFRELNSAIGPSLPQRVRKSIAFIGGSVSAIGAAAGALANFKVPGLGVVIEKGAALFGKMSAVNRSVDQEHRLVSQALRAQKKRFVVIIDDIDRLSPDDALTIFRLVKSVGRLPNVIYLLAFDRAIAERIVAERFPSEGASYLEKILQGAFDLPPPLVDVLRNQAASVALNIMGAPEERQYTRFWNVFFDVVAPTIRTPRDVVRLGNQIATGWPSVAGNVDKADFLAITALQLFEPDVYAAIRAHPDELCGVQSMQERRGVDLANRYDEMLGIHAHNPREKDRLRIALRRLFPRLDAIWANTYRQGDRMRRDRLIASAEHFRSYFAFTISDDVVPASEITDLISHAGDPEFVTRVFLAALQTVRRNGSTKARLLLDELTIHASEIEEASVPLLVQTLFMIGDTLDVPQDQGRGFQDFGNNQFRIHWLLMRLDQRFDQAARERIYQPAVEHGALDWTTDFVERTLAYFRPPDEGDTRTGEPIVSEVIAEQFRQRALEKFQQAAEDGTLRDHRNMTGLLFTWRRLAAEDGVSQVRAWTDRSLADNQFVLALTRGLPSTAWSHGMDFGGMGDRVQRPSVRVNVQAYADILDIPAFEARITELSTFEDLTADERVEIIRFAALPRGRHDRVEDDD